MKQFYLASWVLSIMVLMLFTPLVASAEEGFYTDQQREQQRYQPRTSRGSEKSDDGAFDVQELMGRHTESENRSDTSKDIEDSKQNIQNKWQ